MNKDVVLSYSGKKVRFGANRSLFEMGSVVHLVIMPYFIVLYISTQT